MQEYLLLFWYTPIVYTALTVMGQVVCRIRRRRLGRRRRVSKVIFQIPTIGNVETCNTIVETIKSYNLPVPIETWIIIDQRHYRPEMKFNTDVLVVVPEGFQTSCTYKSRSLEYARRLRLEMRKHGELDDNYIVIQSDDDSTPSKEFMMEAITVDADLMIGTITPRPVGHLFPDYERPVACGMSCLAITNIGIPVWGHGEGMVISARTEEMISYEPPAGVLISSEDMFYLHKAANGLAEDQYLIQNAYRRRLKIYASDKRVYITPPLNARDALRQRRRWMWGHIRLIKNRMLPLRSLATIALAEFTGLSVYAGATTLAFLAPLGLINVAGHHAILAYISLALWLTFRGYNVGRVMGIKHGIRAALLSFPTVTANFIYHVIGIAMGDPRRFDVIKKYVPKPATLQDQQYSQQTTP